MFHMHKNVEENIKIMREMKDIKISNGTSRDKKIQYLT